MDAAPCRAVVDIETAREKQKQLAACQLAPGVIYDNANKNGKQPEGRAPANAMRFNAMRFNAMLVTRDNPRSILVFVVEAQGCVLWFCSSVLEALTGGGAGATTTQGT